MPGYSLRHWPRSSRVGVTCGYARPLWTGKVDMDLSDAFPNLLDELRREIVREYDLAQSAHRTGDYAAVMLHAGKVCEVVIRTVDPKYTPTSPGEQPMLRAGSWSRDLLKLDGKQNHAPRLSPDPPKSRGIRRVVTRECPCGTGGLDLREFDPTRSEGASDNASIAQGICRFR
jgi:hypothetical protein